MGTISRKQVLPKHLARPSGAGPIAIWPWPPASVMRVGFNRGTNGAIAFEEETPVAVRLCERTWRYRYSGKSSKVQAASCWRLEIAVNADDAGPVSPGHMVVVAQQPYGNGWVQCAPLKMYSKKKEHRLQEVLELDQGIDPFDWLKHDLQYDPWETDARYVAGIAFPNGFQDKAPRNSAGNFVLGACPNFNEIGAELFETEDIQQLLFLTEKDKIVFWNPKKVTGPLHLYGEIIDDRVSLMWLSIRQALAGPSEPGEEWCGKPVSGLVNRIYCNHLNERNRVAHRRRKHHEIAVGDYIEHLL